jgi:dTDP-4-amino-4,6-dideoxygalactose transaminase
MYQFGAGTCPNAAKASSEILSLPMHMGVTHADAQRISALIAQYAK